MKKSIALICLLMSIYNCFGMEKKVDKLHDDCIKECYIDYKNRGGDNYKYGYEPVKDKSYDHCLALCKKMHKKFAKIIKENKKD